MKKRYLPFGYVIRDGEIRVDTEQAKIVSGIFEAYIAGNTLQQIAESMTAKQIAYRPDQITWNKNSIRRILTNGGNQLWNRIQNSWPIQGSKEFHPILFLYLAGWKY